MENVITKETHSTNFNNLRYFLIKAKINNYDHVHVISVILSLEIERIIEFLKYLPVYYSHPFIIHFLITSSSVFDIYTHKTITA